MSMFGPKAAQVAAVVGGVSLLWNFAKNCKSCKTEPVPRCIEGFALPGGGTVCTKFEAPEVNTSEKKKPR